MAVCTGCSLLCEDIEVALKTGAIEKAKNLCRKGQGHFQALFSDRTVPSVEGGETSLDQAIEKAANILMNAKDPLLYGWSNSSLEAQKVGIELAKKLEAKIDDTSSFCQGQLLERVLKGELPSCTLDDVRNFADVSVFWGADPSNSHPRHLSRFSYYPRGSKRQKGYEEERNCVVIDVRKSSTAKLCSDYFRIPPGGDAEFAEAIIAILDGKMPRFGDKKRMIGLASIFKKADFGAIFPGLGLVYSLVQKMEIFENLVARLNDVSNYKVVPMVGHYNMRGFNELMLDETGYINQISFKNGVHHGSENSVTMAAKSSDACLVVGSDPLSALPFVIARSLAKSQLVVIDPRRSLTTDAAKVVIPSAMSGLESGGKAVRMDGVRISFEPIFESNLLSDEEILTRIMEAI
ncbi:MAG: formylmethanofuran dehydrogenase subunit B [Methanotrichaceae archaeon]|nr:formylmethanofuran dehydrogenase subunit B [Methanotrichaceae archaeon]